MPFLFPTSSLHVRLPFEGRADGDAEESDACHGPASNAWRPGSVQGVPLMPPPSPGASPRPRDRNIACGLLMPTLLRLRILTHPSDHSCAAVTGPCQGWGGSPPKATGSSGAEPPGPLRTRHHSDDSGTSTQDSPRPCPKACGARRVAGMSDAGQTPGGKSQSHEYTAEGRPSWRGQGSGAGWRSR